MILFVRENTLRFETISFVRENIIIMKVNIN